MIEDDSIFSDENEWPSSTDDTEDMTDEHGGGLYKTVMTVKGEIIKLLDPVSSNLPERLVIGQRVRIERLGKSLNLSGVIEEFRDPGTYGAFVKVRIKDITKDPVRWLSAIEIHSESEHNESS